MTKTLVLAIAVLLGSLIAAKAQSPALADQNDIQSWNDIQLTVALSKKVDFQTQATARFSKNISRLNDARFQFGFIFKPDKTWSIHPFYLYINARNARGVFLIEHRLNLRLGYKFPIKKFGLSHRSLLEYRIRGTGNSWRYRPSLTIEKELPKKFISGAKLYATEEVFYDSILNKFSRNRFTIGINKTLTKKLSLEIYYMRQNDGNSRPGDLNVAGTSWKIKL